MDGLAWFLLGVSTAYGVRLCRRFWRKQVTDAANQLIRELRSEEFRNGVDLNKLTPYIRDDA